MSFDRTPFNPGDDNATPDRATLSLHAEQLHPRFRLRASGPRPGCTVVLAFVLAAAAALTACGGSDEPTGSQARHAHDPTSVVSTDVVRVDVACCGEWAVELAVWTATTHHAVADAPAAATVFVSGSDAATNSEVVDRLRALGIGRVALVAS